MLGFVVRRLLMMLPVAFVVSVVAFLLVQLSPGDPASFFVPPEAPPEQIEAVRERLGVDQPTHVQFVNWLGRAVRGDLGVSFHQRRPVLEAYISAAPVTLSLAALSLVFALLIAIPIGLLSALKRNSLMDKFATVFIFGGVSVPNFWLGALLVVFIALNVGFFPAQGYNTETLMTRFGSLVLPAIALGYSEAAMIARMTRSSMLEVMREDYVKTARAKGLRPKSVLLKHTFFNAFNPVLTVIGLSVASLVAGSAVVETVFNIPGIGRLIVDSVLRRDYPVIQGGLLLTAVLIIVVNLIVDVMYALLDPRVRHD